MQTPKHSAQTIRRAFTLIEMVTVIAILVTLMTAGVSLLNGTGSQSRKTGTDMIAGLIEQARTRAITTRKIVLLAVSEPMKQNLQDRCRLALFEVKQEDWNAAVANPSASGRMVVAGVAVTKWQTLNTGIVLYDGWRDGETGNVNDEVKNLTNLLPNNGNGDVTDGPVTITYGGIKNLSVKAHVMGFNSRGALVYPEGPNPIALRIAEGGYRNDKRSANLRGDRKTTTENVLIIGRVTARPYQID